MKQISDKILLIPITQIKSQYKDSILFVDNPSIYNFISSSPINFSQKYSNSSSGLLYEVSLNCVCNTKDSSILQINNISIVVRLTCMDRTSFCVGSKDVPAKIIITPHENNMYHINISCKSVLPLNI